MPLTLRPPRPGKTPNYEIRGRYLGVDVERTAGTPDKRQAGKALRRIKRSIERGEYQDPARPPVTPPAPPTFNDAALAYLKAGGDPKGLSPIIEASGEHALAQLRLTDIDQIKIDNAARALYPNAAAATLNRQFYTPVSAVMKRAGVERKIRRPKGWRGSKATSWLQPEQAFPLIEACYGIEPEFGLFCLLLLYTGMRLSDPIQARLRDLRLDAVDDKGAPRPMLYLPATKNSEPRAVHLPPVVVEAFRAQPPRPARPRARAPGLPEKTPALPNGAAGRARSDAGVPFLERDPGQKLFRFCKGGRLCKMLKLALIRAGLSFPPRQGGFHLFCHTYGTWMHNYAALDTYGLTRTRRWKDPDSTDRYIHTMASFEARQADLLPVAPKRKERRA
jgi:integrase